MLVLPGKTLFLLLKHERNYIILQFNYHHATKDYTIVTCDVITDGVRFGPKMVKVFATLNLTFATRSVAIVRIVGSINLSVISAPQASAKTCKW